MDKLKNFTQKTLAIDGQDLKVLIWQKAQIGDSAAPRIIIPAKLPDKSTITILDLCIKTIKKFTDTPYELWVIDNNSPMENLEWLFDVEGINIVLNRNEAKEPGSYENALGLEIGINVIDPDTQYLMTVHQDTAPAKKGWLKFLLSKLNDEVRAAGVREDKARVKDGILHVLGYLIDFQFIKKSKLSFFPQLPDFDVGDKIIVELKKQGYKYFAAPNTLWDPSLVEKLPKDSPFRDFHVDRSLDDDNQVFFLHMGRGVLKSTGEYQDGELAIREWEEFITKNLLNESKIETNHKERLKNKLTTELWYSLRRYYVDDFFLSNVNVFKEGASIIDIGGIKNKKRGEFNINNYNLDVKYANIDKDDEPDYLCDAAYIPVKDNFFDGFILAEVLEHVPHPNEVLKEAFRVIKSGGIGLITTPFMFHTHADPYDFTRFTDYWYESVLKEIGFSEIRIIKQGLMFSVIANMLKTWAYSLLGEGKPRSNFKRNLFHKLILYISKKAVDLDQKESFSSNKIFNSNTTGFGVICIK